jgi:acetyltransferase-like isoleucine patch superfamily enzyme
MAVVHIGAGVRIGDHVIALQGASISHDCEIEDYSTITGRVSLPSNVTIRRAAYIGMGAAILNGVEIGERAVVGLGAVVTKNVLPGDVVIGNPEES